MCAEQSLSLFYFKQCSSISQSIWNNAVPLRFRAPFLISLPSSLLVPTFGFIPLFSPAFLLLAARPSSSGVTPAAGLGQTPRWHSGCRAQLPSEGPRTFVLSSHSSSNLCLWTRGIRPGLIFITTPPWLPPHHHSNHQCALSLSRADTWPAPDGHRPAWPPFSTGSSELKS